MEIESQNTDESGQYLGQFVGEGKKYKTVEDLAKAYANADQFIEALKAQNDDLKQEVNKRMAVEEFIKAKQDQTETVTNTAPADHDGGGEQVETKTEAKPEAENAPKVDESELIERIKAELRKDDEAATAEQNTTAVVNRLKEVYGDNDAAINEAIAQKAKEIGVSVQWLQDTAAKSPKAFFSLTGIDAGKPAPNGPKPAVNTAGLPSSDASKPQPGTKAYYDALRKENLNKFLSQEVQRQYMKDAMADPAKFFGNTN